MKISVIGLGYVGSVTAAGMAARGHQVLAIDIDPERVATYNDGDIPFYEPGLADLISDVSRRGNLRFAHTGGVTESLGEVTVIATGTPTSETGAADLGQVRDAIRWTLEQQPAGGTILMKSTVPPGTGERLRSGLLSRSKFQYVTNPEFLREGHAIDDWFHPDRLVIGAAEARLPAEVEKLYQGFEDPLLVTDITSAEMIKYASNAFLAMKISFINEIAAMCDKLGATIDDVSQGIALDRRIGPSSLSAGVGYGGSCFPKDIRALDFLALTNDHNLELLRSVITVNNRQRILPLHALRDCFESLTGVAVGVLGLSFKPETDDIREAPAIDLIRCLVEEGAVVRAYDPQAMPRAGKALPREVELTGGFDDCVTGARAVVLMTEWPQIMASDWAKASQLAAPPRFLFDGRNALDPGEMRRLGFLYRGVGRGATSSPKISAKELHQGR